MCHPDALSETQDFSPWLWRGLQRMAFSFSSFSGWSGLKNTVLPRVVPPFRAVHIQWLINEGILKPGPLSSTSEPLWGHANLQAESSVRNASWFSVTLCPTISSSLSYVLTSIAESTSWEPNLRPRAKSYPINWGRVCGYILHKESEKWDKGK